MLPGAYWFVDLRAPPTQATAPITRCRWNQAGLYSLKPRARTTDSGMSSAKHTAVRYPCTWEASDGERHMRARITIRVGFRDSPVGIRLGLRLGLWPG